MPTLALIHLVRAENDLKHLCAFMTTYRALQAGVNHELVLACKGFKDYPPAALAQAYAGLPVTVISLPDSGFDLGSYRRACFQLRADFICVVNSFSRPMAAGWLGRIYEVATRPGVGIAGATGSLEIDPHIRTNGFCIRRDLYLDLVTGDPVTKAAACAVEASTNSLTARIRARGLAARVVPREGPDLEVTDARDTATFRWGLQRNLLIADNRTDEYLAADASYRAFLEERAWGARQ